MACVCVCLYVYVNVFVSMSVSIYVSVHPVASGLCSVLPSLGHIAMQAVPWESLLGAKMRESVPSKKRSLDPRHATVSLSGIINCSHLGGAVCKVAGVNDGPMLDVFLDSYTLKEDLEEYLVLGPLFVSDIDAGLALRCVCTCAQMRGEDGEGFLSRASDVAPQASTL